MMENNVVGSSNTTSEEANGSVTIQKIIGISKIPCQERG